jgi:iron complex outermembrane receptor protein
MNFKRNLLSEAVRYGIAAGAVGLISLAAAPAFAQDDTEEEAQSLERIEVTGSRIKRADVEGALPVTVIDRQDLELSGDNSVADFLRNTTFNSFGSFRPQSGSSAQSVATLSLRGLGSGSHPDPRRRSSSAGRAEHRPGPGPQRPAVGVGRAYRNPV